MSAPVDSVRQRRAPMACPGDTSITEPLLGTAPGAREASDNARVLETPLWRTLVEHLWALVSRAVTRIWTWLEDALESVHCLAPSPLSPLQQARWELLRAQVGVPYSAEDKSHVALLRALWAAVHGEAPFPANIRDERWKDMGWQSDDPGRDFRGGGVLALRCVLSFARRRPEEFERIMRKQTGSRSEWEYPFAAAGVNLVHVLATLLGLGGSARAGKAPPRGFAHLLADSPRAFEEMVVYGYQVLDAQWLAQRASYMEFPRIMKDVQKELERVAQAKNCSVDLLRAMGDELHP